MRASFCGAQVGAAAAVAGGNADGALAAGWAAICGGTRPLLHRLLLQHSRSPQAWIERRERFGQSLAAGCVAGWVVGLGDRAPRSLLYDPRSGQLLHTRLHLVLSTALTLPLPEEVPFRLTRELRDGLGPSGDGAPFRARCEAALRQLRREDASAALLCVLEAFAHDGLGQLARWSVAAAGRNGPAEADALNGDEEAVELALLEARHKLRAADEGVEGQVRTLVLQATDEPALMAMPPSWKSWL